MVWVFLWNKHDHQLVMQIFITVLNTIICAAKTLFNPDTPFPVAAFLYVACCSIHCLCVNYSYRSQWIYNNQGSENNGWVSFNWEIERNLQWYFCRKTWSKSWKIELLCLREIDRILFVSLWTSVFTSVIDNATLYFSSINLICSLILQACLDLFCAKIPHHNPTCRHATWPGKNLVTESGQNCKNYLQWYAV